MPYSASAARTCSTTRTRPTTPSPPGAAVSRNACRSLLEAAIRESQPLPAGALAAQVRRRRGAVLTLH